MTAACPGVDIEGHLTAAVTTLDGAGVPTCRVHGTVDVGRILGIDDDVVVELEQ